MAPGGEVGGGGDVLLVRKSGGVHHDGPHPGGDALTDEVRIGDVVEVDRDPGRGALGEGERGTGDGQQAAVVADAVLADLKDQWDTGALGGGDERLGGLQMDDIEGRGTGPRLTRGVDDR
ncbi:hypothetical protein TPA0598_10_02080 [Streptomyces lydicamycinicus]|uniref:Uncharacterized protein n=1 Tax=Streptomyces lydicamycinicus TaxID=1546107 RepID=A0A0P4RG38_9ACTN|nr:hypothetical protein TPA0598_10_02080 [Streptomyces lydicamycinicus]